MANSINYNVLCFSRDPNNNNTAHRSVDNKLLTFLNRNCNIFAVNLDLIYLSL